MKILTSNYAKASRHSDSSILYVRVSASVPKWFFGRSVTVESLYPSWELINGYKSGTLSEQEYTKRYKEQLSNLDKESIRRLLEDEAGALGCTTIVLLCWCGRGFCHRHLLNEWLGGDGEME